MNGSNEIITAYNSADILGKGSDRVVFNIGGNNFRLICKYHFVNTRVYLLSGWDPMLGIQNYATRENSIRLMYIKCN